MADPTARDVETAVQLAGPCWYATSDHPTATCAAVGDTTPCQTCRTARALATARAEEREATLALVAMATDATRACLSEKLRVEEEHYYRGRVEHGEHVRDLIVKHAAIRARGEGA